MEVSNSPLKSFNLGASSVCDIEDYYNRGNLHYIEEAQRLRLSKVVAKKPFIYGLRKSEAS